MNKTPQFVEFRNAGSRIGKEFLGVTKNGAISIYAGFYSRKGIKKFSKCLLLLDKQQGLIGIQFGEKDELGDGSYNVNHDKNFKTAYLAASNFFSINNLDVQKWYGRYVPQKVDDPNRKNIFMIDLDKKIPIIRKPNIRKPKLQKTEEIKE